MSHKHLVVCLLSRLSRQSRLPLNIVSEDGRRQLWSWTFWREGWCNRQYHPSNISSSPQKRVYQKVNEIHKAPDQENNKSGDTSTYEIISLIFEEEKNQTKKLLNSQQKKHEKLNLKYGKLEAITAQTLTYKIESYRLYAENIGP